MPKIQSLLIATTLSVLLFACKKSSNETAAVPSQTDLQTQSDDENRVSTEMDAAFDDVNATMTSQLTVTGAAHRYGVVTTGGNQDTVTTLICDAVVTVDTVDNPRTITITYIGGHCQVTRSRTGSIVISMEKGMKWTAAGAHVTVNFNNLKISRLLDGKSIILNGTHTYTNVSGGSLLSLNVNSTAPIVHTISSDNMSITFDNGMQRNWNVARQRAYSYSGGLVLTTTGTHTDGSTTGISEWGTNRFGDAFTVQIVHGLTIEQGCGWQLTGGEVALANAAGTTDITFGLDAKGESISCPLGTGIYYFQLVWTGKGGKTYTFVLPY